MEGLSCDTPDNPSIFLNRLGNNYMKFSKILYLVCGLLLTVASVGSLASCTDDLGFKGQDIDLGEKVKGVMTVPLTVPVAGKATRTVDFDPNAILKVDSYWIGVYDTHTGELLGSKYDAAPRKEDNSRYTFNGTSTTFTVEDVDIYYYDNHPEAFVVGVVNFNNVKAKNAGLGESLSNLIDLLEDAKDWDAFCSISIDAASAERANPNESDGFGKIPLMMGYYTTGANAAHPTVKGWDNNSVEQSNVKTRFTDAPDGSVALPFGALKLMRLVSQVTVHVGGPEIMNQYPGSSTRADEPVLKPVPVYPPIDEENIVIKNLQYKVVNNPKSFYLAERATDPLGFKISGEEDYKKRSANSSDYDGENGYTETGWIPVNGNTFTYQHYENKHWGDGSWFEPKDLLKDPDSYNPSDFNGELENLWSEMDGVYFIREKKHNGTDFLRTLCGNSTAPYNNNSSYIIIKGDLEFKLPEDADDPVEKFESGSFEYTIHEGFICDVDGAVIEMPHINSRDEYEEKIAEYTKKTICDFQRFRNTKYDYYISINGLSQIMMQVQMAQFGEEFGFDPESINNDGLKGKYNVMEPLELDGKGTLELFNGMSGLSAYPLLPRGIGGGPDNGLWFSTFWDFYTMRKGLKWRYRVHDLNGEHNYGLWSDEDNNVTGIPAIKSALSANCPDEVLNSFKFIITENTNDTFNYPEGTDFIIPGKKIYEWNIREFIENDVVLNYDDFISNGSLSVPKYTALVYISPQTAPGVDYSKLDEIYRNFYFKLPVAKDFNGTAEYNYYFGVNQAPMDNRTEIYENPTLDIKDHHYYHSYSGYWTTAHNLVNYICWDWKYEDVRAEYFLLKIGDGEEIEVRSKDWADPLGKIHYPLSITSEISKGFNSISIRPMGLMNSDGTPANYKMTSPVVFTDALLVLTDPKWTFNSSSVFASALGPDGSIYNGTVERYGMTIYGSSGSSGLKPYLGSGFIQTGGSGSSYRRSFNIVVDRPGKLVVNVCKTADGDVRGLYMQERGMESGEVSQSNFVEVDRSIGDPANFEFPTSNIKEPTELVLYPSGNLNIYWIEFVPD